MHGTCAGQQEWSARVHAMVLAAASARGSFERTRGARKGRCMSYLMLNLASPIPPAPGVRIAVFRAAWDASTGSHSLLVSDGRFFYIVHTTFTLTRNVVDGVCAQRPLLQSGRCPRTASTLTHRKVGGVCAQRSLLQSGRCARRASTLTRHIVDAAHAQRSLLQSGRCAHRMSTRTLSESGRRARTASTSYKVISVRVQRPLATLKSDQCAHTASTLVQGSTLQAQCLLGHVAHLPRFHLSPEAFQGLWREQQLLEGGRLLCHRLTHSVRVDILTSSVSPVKLASQEDGRNGLSGRRSSKRYTARPTFCLCCARSFD